MKTLFITAVLATASAAQAHIALELAEAEAGQPY